MRFLKIKSLKLISYEFPYLFTHNRKARRSHECIQTKRQEFSVDFRIYFTHTEKLIVRMKLFTRKGKVFFIHIHIYFTRAEERFAVTLHS